MITRPGFLVFPAYIFGIFALFACLNLLPPVAGMSVAAILLLVMLTPASLLHPVIGEHDGILHVIIYCLCLASAVAFAMLAIPKDLGPVAYDTGMTWLQVALIVTQQALYFGLHAFHRAR